MSETDRVRIALENLLQSLVDCQSFEVEFGAAGDGPMFRAYEVLGKEPPQVLKDWLDRDESWTDSWED